MLRLYNRMNEIGKECEGKLFRSDIGVKVYKGDICECYYSWSFEIYLTVLMFVACEHT